jgi:predicted kinase
MDSPLLIILGGRPGSGKTTIARELAARMGAMHLRIDTIEEVLRSGGVEDIRDLGYRIAYAVAEENLRLGRTVIADSVNPLPLTRTAWRSVAKRVKARYVEIEVICSDDEERRLRMQARRVRGWKKIFARDYEPWGGKRVVVDTAGAAVAESVDAIERAIRARESSPRPSRPPRTR